MIINDFNVIIKILFEHLYLIFDSHRGYSSRKEFTPLLPWSKFFPLREVPLKEGFLQTLLLQLLFIDIDTTKMFVSVKSLHIV